MDEMIFKAVARIDDSEAMAKFLVAIPNSEGLEALLQGGEPVYTRAYHDETSSARFVVSDGTTAMCFTVTNITIDQAEMIATACEQISEWGSETFQSAVELALGVDFRRPS